MAGIAKGDVFGVVACCVANVAAVGQQLHEAPIAGRGIAAGGQFFHVEHRRRVNFAVLCDREGVLDHHSAGRHAPARSQIVVAGPGRSCVGEVVGIAVAVGVRQIGRDVETLPAGVGLDDGILGGGIAVRHLALDLVIDFFGLGGRQGAVDFDTQMLFLGREGGQNETEAKKSNEGQAGHNPLHSW